MTLKEIDARDEFLSTPLHYAAFRGAAVCCLLLLERGADLEAVDRRGNTPLAYAVLGGHEGCALVLLQKRANLNVTVHPDMTAAVGHTSLRPEDLGCNSMDISSCLIFCPMTCLDSRHKKGVASVGTYKGYLRHELLLLLVL